MSTSSWLGPRSVDGGLDEVDVGGVAGRLWLCGKHVVGPDPAAALARAGHAEVIVCLNERHELEDRYPNYVAWMEANAGGASLWSEVPDLHVPEPAEVRYLATGIAERLRAAQGVVVHCGAGMGRAPTIAVCALMVVGFERDSALDAVTAARPLAGPESGAQADLVRGFEP